MTVQKIHLFPKINFENEYKVLLCDFRVESDVVAVYYSNYRRTVPISNEALLLISYLEETFSEALPLGFLTFVLCECN